MNYIMLNEHVHHLLINLFNLTGGSVLLSFTKTKKIKFNFHHKLGCVLCMSWYGDPSKNLSQIVPHDE